MLADTKSEYESIIEVFERQVAKTPNKTAVVFEEEQITYEELNKRSEQLAYKLLKSGINKGDFVVLLTQRSIELVIAVYAVIKAGAVYIPIDPSYPEKRINFIIKDCKPAAIVSYGVDSIPYDGTMIRLEENMIDMDDIKLPKPNSNPDDILYIIYTSGTTGAPKGVMVTHNNLTRLIKTAKEIFQFTEEDIWTMFHSYCFDFSVWEMHGALLTGGMLHVIDRSTAIDSFAFANYIIENEITILNQVPSAFYHLLQTENDSLPSVRYLIFGGEKLNPERLKHFHKKNPKIHIINMYGITETTVHVTYREISQEEIENGISSIGKPLPDLQVYIMNDGKKADIGQAGEICVAGAGVSKGYLNHEQLTQERFIKNPFGTGVLYCSGDLGRILEDGNIEYLGRKDEQVKIRGYRIELEEIENAIRSIEGVRDAAVIVCTNQHNENELGAYVISENTDIPEEIKSILKEKLPNYMIPAKIMVVDSFPLTANGKLDRKAFPKIMQIHGSDFAKPETPIEEELVKIWSSTLDVNQFGIHDNFLELGGHSLIANQIVYRINKEFDIDLTIMDFLLNGLTIHELGNIVEEKIILSLSDEEISAMLEEN